jgi:hypothetical protein
MLRKEKMERNCRRYSVKLEGMKSFVGASLEGLGEYDLVFEEFEVFQFKASSNVFKNNWSETLVRQFSRCSVK